MQSPHEFMLSYFRARTEQIKLELERRAPFRQKYFVSECPGDARTTVLKESEEEQILSVSESGEEVEVVTRIQGDKNLRYILSRAKETWLIKQVYSKPASLNAWVDEEQMKKFSDLCKSNVIPG